MATKDRKTLHQVLLFLSGARGRGGGLTRVLFAGVLCDVNGHSVDNEIPDAADKALLQRGGPEDGRDPERLHRGVDPAQIEGTHQLQPIRFA